MKARDEWKPGQWKPGKTIAGSKPEERVTKEVREENKIGRK